MNGLAKYCLSFLLLLVSTVFAFGHATIEKATVTLSDAQIKAWPTNPVTVATSTSGHLFIPVYATFVADLQSAYSNVSNNNGRIVVEDGISGYTFLQGVMNNGTSLDDFGALFGSYGIGYLRTLAPAIPAAKADEASGVVVPRAVSGTLTSNSIVLRCINGSDGNFTGGDAANTLKVAVYYIVEDV